MYPIAMIMMDSKQTWKINHGDKTTMTMAGGMEDILLNWTTRANEVQQG